MADITIPLNPRKPLTVQLGDEMFDVKPPKATFGIVLAQRAKVAGDDPGLVFAEMMNWMSAAFGKKVAKDLEKRLMDPEDLLDLTHVTDLMTQVTEKATGNPTT